LLIYSAVDRSFENHLIRRIALVTFNVRDFSAAGERFGVRVMRRHPIWTVTGSIALAKAAKNRSS
jgi:hypothetical protein